MGGEGIVCPTPAYIYKASGVERCASSVVFSTIFSVPVCPQKRSLETTATRPTRHRRRFFLPCRFPLDPLPPSKWIQAACPCWAGRRRLVELVELTQECRGTLTGEGRFEQEDANRGEAPTQQKDSHDGTPMRRVHHGLCWVSCFRCTSQNPLCQS
jgi:hypothetical protein